MASAVDDTMGDTTTIQPEELMDNLLSEELRKALNKVVDKSVHSLRYGFTDLFLVEFACCHYQRS